MSWFDGLPESAVRRIRQLVPLAPLTTWRIGGRARWLAEPDSEAELSAILVAAADAGLDVRVMGGGSNLLVCDGVLESLVVRLHGGAFAACVLDPESGAVNCGSGLPLQTLLGRASLPGLAGLEELAGIPGSVGGAARMNAGSGGKSFGETVRRVRCLDATGEPLALEGEEISFFYRASNLGEFLVTGVDLRLVPEDSAGIRVRQSAALERKRASQPLEAATCGCVFKNPTGHSAGKLIDEAGGKGLFCGGCRVSDKHANFFINDGHAACDDALRLIDLVRSRVEKTTGIILELEVCLWK